MTNSNRIKKTSDNKILPILKSVASIKLTVICLVILAFLVVWGTVYQAEFGLYQAQQKFFHSWFFFIFGLIPFPGTVLIMYVLFLNLLSALFFRIGIRWTNIGNIITHIGILILLAGGFFTSLLSQESSLMLKEGESSSLSTSRHQWELAVWEPRKGDVDVYAVDTNGTKPGKTIRFQELGLELAVREYYKNCSAFSGKLSNENSIINASGIKVLKGKPSAMEVGENIAGGIFTVNPNSPHKQELLLYGEDVTPTRLNVDGRNFFFSLRKKRLPLPLRITLKDFRVKYYPNSQIPKSFESAVLISGEDGIERDVLISMNKPLRYKEYTFFQSSYYIAPRGDEYTILAVVKNVGRLLPYFSSLTIFLGLLIHFLVMLFNRRKRYNEMQKSKSNTVKSPILLLVLMSSLLFCATGNKVSAQVDSLEHLSKVAIMENGRIKPLDTFAENLLKQFSGQSRYQKKPAIIWLAKVLFTPENSFEDKVFLITNQEVLDSIDVKRVGKARNRYSFNQLKLGLPKLRRLAMKVSRLGDKSRSFIENEIVSLYNKLYIFQQLTASLNFLFPHEDFTINESATLVLLQLPENQKHFSYLSLAEKESKIESVLASIKDKEPDQLTPAEKEITDLSRRLQQWARFYGELPLAIIPSKSPSGEEKWISPWALASFMVLHKESETPETLSLFRKVWEGYLDQNQEKFDSNLQKFNQLVLEKENGRIRANAISREVFLNRLDPFYKAKFFYGFSILFLLLSFIILRKWLYRFAFLLITVGFLLHLYGILTRMYISSRPPVTNLYETFLFTGLIAVLLGIILEFFKKKNIGIATGSLAGLIMLMIAGKYAVEGDTMGMLVAVLDSNFWLASHVITIILGYAGVVLSGFIGHVYIVQRIIWPTKKELLKNTFQAVYAIQAFGIIFTFLGTVLGGIWADQSWGRFWGWDPKENGALLILLWSAILFHARLAKMIKDTGFAIGSIIGVVAVSLAWFGVNLLGVGLHSYGFTSGIARALFIFIGVESLFIIVSLLFLKSGQEMKKLSPTN